jgi:Trk K+ transport system NAD-binding subunit
MERPVILCGLGQVGWRVLEYLRMARIPVVAIDNRASPSDRRLANVRFVKGDCRRSGVLERAGVAQARAVLILTSSDLVNISTALMVRHVDPDVRIIVSLFNQNLVPRLGKAVSNTLALSVYQLTAPLFAFTALAGQALGAFHMETGRCEIADLIIYEGSALSNQTVADIAARYQARIVAHVPAQGPERFLLDVDPEALLLPGDHLVVSGDPRALAPLLAEGGEDALPGVRWAGWLRRMGRVVLRTLLEVDLAVKISGAVLLVAIVLGTLVHSLGMGRRLDDALYRTVSVVATAAHMDADENRPWTKIFVSALRIAGVALIASFTAIFTNYLLRARLSGALEVRRIPDSGHVVVCGLGNLGFRVVEELLQCGERVVVIEQQRDSRFMAAARRLGIAIIVADATVLEVLRQAHAATARAIVAATNDELINLEVALLTRELNPQSRVVLRVSDPNLADTLRDAASIRYALSIPSLAAPAFVAAVFGDRVSSMFLVKGQLLVAIELTVLPEDSHLDRQPVRALAIDYRLLPVSLIGADGMLRPQPMNHRLSVGDRLTVVAALADLERLLRRECAPADFAVDVTGFILPARSFVLQLVRTQQRLSEEAAEGVLANLPFCAGTDLTYGQAEELLVTLGREGAKARIRRLDRIAIPEAGVALK